MSEDKKYKLDGKFMTWDELEEWAEDYLSGDNNVPKGQMLSLTEYTAKLMTEVDSKEFEDAMRTNSLELYLKALTIKEGRNPDEVVIPEELKKSDPRTPKYKM